MASLRVILCVALVSTAAASVIVPREAESSLPRLSPRHQQLLEELSPGWEEGWQEYGFAPYDPKEEQKDVRDSVNYFLWTRSNPSAEYTLLVEDNANVAASPLDTSKPIYFIYHGFSSNGRNSWILAARDGYLANEDCNVISVDYSALVPAPYYGTAVMNVYETADLTVTLIDWLVSDFGLNLQTTTLSGHSIGCHCAGVTGTRINSGTVTRVSGLDPAGPLFYQQIDALRINPDSGYFVDIIHANGGFLAAGCVGLIDQVGDIDFYPNGGVHQPGCYDDETAAGILLDLLFGCSHSRAHDFWVESIQNGSFTGKPCSDWDTYEAGQCSSCGDGCVMMGSLADISGLPSSPSQGYYLTTNAESPYAQG